jgi:hypothetical protein
MSAPEDRLVEDQETEMLQHQALAVLSQHQQFSLIRLQIAFGVLALIRDREARQELAVECRSCPK